jgi:hypothetical protein
LNKRGNETRTEELIELAKVLDLMPLAITQTAAFINKRRPHFPVTQYLAWFKKSDRKRANLLKQEHEGASTRRDWEAKHLIYDHLANII